MLAVALHPVEGNCYVHEFVWRHGMFDLELHSPMHVYVFGSVLVLPMHNNSMHLPTPRRNLRKLAQTLCTSICLVIMLFVSLW